MFFLVKLRTLANRYND